MAFRRFVLFWDNSCGTGFPFEPSPSRDVIDVDTAEDINLAERFISRIRGVV